MNEPILSTTTNPTPTQIISNKYPDIMTKLTSVPINDNGKNIKTVNVQLVIPKDSNDPITFANIQSKAPTGVGYNSSEEITCANVGVNPGEIQNAVSRHNRRTFEPVRLKRNDGPLIIKDKRWYFRLVKENKGNYRGARRLMDDFSIYEISHHMIVCFTPNYLPGNELPFRGKDGSPGRIYAFFDSYLEFYDYMQKFPPEERSFYEVVFGELPQKPHFDIDIDIKDITALYPTEDIDTVAETLREYVIRGCIEVLDENMVTLDLTRDVLLYSSHCEDKRSYHLVLNNKCNDGNKEAKAFYCAVMNKVRTYTKGKYLEFVDKSVYSSRQQFRIVGCQKLGSNRPKVFYEQFRYQGQQYTHIYNEDVSDITIKKLTIIYESLVSFTSGCIFLPSLVSPKLVNHHHPGDTTDLDRSIVECCMSMLREKMEYCPFSVKEVVGSLILLKRNAPSHCPICRKSKPHEHENSFMYVVGGKVYWDCRRCPDDAKRLFVGYLAMSIEQLRSGEIIPGFTDGEVEDDHNDQGGFDSSTGDISEFMLGDYNIGAPTLPPIKKHTHTPDRNKPQRGNSSGKNTPANKSPPIGIPQPTPDNNTVTIPIINLAPEQRMQNVQAATMKIARDWDQKKYIRREPEDLAGVRSLASVSKEIAWTPGRNRY